MTQRPLPGVCRAWRLVAGIAVATVAVATVGVVTVAVATAAETVAAAPGAAVQQAAPVVGARVSVLTGEQVVQILDQTVEWYRTLGTQQQAASQPSDCLLYTSRCV